MIGFTAFSTSVSIPTTQELLASLTDTQKTGILTSFANRVSPTQVKHQFGVRQDVVAYFYGKINEIQTYSRKLMREEVTTIVDEEVIITPSPTTSEELTILVVAEFIDEFSSGQTTAILTKMVQFSKPDGSGNWAWYSSKIVE